MRSEEIHPGDVIAGKYRVRAILGRAHGLVLEAFHTEFDQRVVIKVLLAGAGDEREIERFRREARTLAKLESEHAARIIDVGTEQDGSFYLVRQYLDGMDLGAYVRKSGPLLLVDAVLAILMVAEAVAETHSHGIILRELQPSHLFLTQRPGGSPLVRISDFGTAKLMRDAAAPGVGAEITATAMFGLSPYSSPELLRKAKNVDARTDVWSLGAVLYELLTGRPPFAGETTALMLQITRDEPVPPSELVLGLPPEVDQIIGWALAKDVDARFKNVHAFAHSLQPFASPEGQVLIERIGQIADAGRPRRRGGSAPPPAFPSARPPKAPVTLPPPSMPSAPRLEDSVTGVRAAPGSMPPPGYALHAALPPPPALPAQLGEAQWNASSTAPTSAAPPPAAPAPVPAMSPGRKAALGVIALAAVLVPVLLVLLLLKQSSAPAGEEASATASATPTAAAAATEAPPPVVVPPPAPSPEPAPVEPAPSPAVTDTPSAAPQEAPASTAVSANALPDARPAARASRPSAPAPPPPVAAPPAGPSGTLLAVAVGGTCSFSVNGAGKGTSSSIKLSLKPGTYSVVCRAHSGTKSKSVTVKSGETAMAAFKL
jgi:serine/threonine-protein kinase